MLPLPWLCIVAACPFKRGPSRLYVPWNISYGQKCYVGQIDGRPPGMLWPLLGTAGAGRSATTPIGRTEASSHYRVVTAVLSGHKQGLGSREVPVFRVTKGFGLPRGSCRSGHKRLWPPARLLSFGSQRALGSRAAPVFRVTKGFGLPRGSCLSGHKRLWAPARFLSFGSQIGIGSGRLGSWLSGPSGVGSVVGLRLPSVSLRTPV
jgi:hypothetical protein